MNALLNINIRVNSAAANAQVQALRSNMNSLTQSVTGQSAGINAFNNTLGRLSGLERFGKNLQWTGRQLEFNFTLPLVLAGAAATKFALDNERAMVGVRKVYGDLADDATMLQAELAALERSFELLSSRFGVHQAEVIEIGAAWAQAGAAGVALAKATRLTLEAMILGEMDAIEATNGLIAVQSAYRLNTVQLKDAIAQLNIVENQTSISLKGLIDVITRAGGAAASAGIDIRHLAAMAAALVPATGTATQAGNALRTLISRIMAPTKDASDIMAAFGINILDASWQAKNGVERIESLAKAFDNLTQSEKTVASALIASRWQINRFDILLGDVAKSLDESTRKQSAYAKALDATSEAQKYTAVYARELSIALASQPRGFAILTNVIRNSLATAIAPMLPAFAGLLARVAQLVTWFSKLDPGVQQLALAFMVLLALVGPLTRYLGSFILLGTTLGRALGFVRVALFGMTGAQIAAATATQLANTSLLHQTGIVGVLGVALMKLIRGPFVLLALAWEAMIAVTPYLLRAFSAVFTVIGGLVVRSLAGAATLGMSGMVAMVAGGLHRVTALFAAIPAILAQVWLAVATATRGLMTGFTLTFITATRTITLVWYGLNSVMTTVWFTTVMALQRAWIAFQVFIARFPSVMALVWVGAVRATQIGLAAIRASVFAFQVFMASVPAAIAAAFTSPWVLLGVAVVGILIMLRKQVAAGVQWIIDQFKRLIPALGAIMRRVFELLSYLNPFARHSPSLVDNVRAGVSTILDEFERLKGISGILNEALDALEAFSGASGGLREAELVQLTAQKEDIISVSPAAGPEIDRLIDKIFRLKDALRLVGQELQEQRRISEAWQRSLEAAMQPINDAIFENEMAQKRLRLEILKMEQAGVSVDKMKDRMAALAGEMEMMRGEATELRLAGAGSDILAAYNTELAAMEEEFSSLQGQKSPIEQMQNELEELQRQGEILQLQRDIEFDPQIRALEAQKKKVNELEDAYQAINSTIGDMEAALREAASAARTLKEAQEKKEKEPDTTFGQELFAAAGAGDFDVPGGESVPGLGREGGLPEIEQFNAELEAELNRVLKDMGKIDIFGPLKDLWRTTWGWIKENVGPFVAPVIETVKGWFGTADVGFSFDGIRKSIGDLWQTLSDSNIGEVFDFIGNAFKTVGDVISFVWDHVIGPIFKFIVDNVKWAGKELGDEFKNWSPIFDQATEAFSHIYNVIADILNILLNVVIKPFLAILFAAWKVGWPIIAAVVEPVFRTVITIIRAALEFIRGFITLILNVINGDWAAAWQSILTIVDAIWDAIWAVISAPIRLIWNLIETFVGAIVGFFKWLWEKLVGHSIVPDIVNGIVDLFRWLFDAVSGYWDALWAAIKWVWENVVKPVFNAIKWAIENVVVPAFNWAKDTIGDVFERLGRGIKNIWETVISPVFDAIKTGIDTVAGAFWWFKDHVIQPVWDGIKEIIKGAWNGLATILEGGINGFIMAFNVLARGINLVTSVIKVGPHIETIGHIDIPRFAKGGIPAMELGGPGGVFNMPTGIIGEGSRVFPEYVIPTDPRYRKNAFDLYAQLGGRLFESGGLLGGKEQIGDGIGDWFGKAVEFGKFVIGGGVGAVKAFWDIINKIPDIIRNLIEIPKNTAGMLMGNVIDWVKDLIKNKIFGADDLGDNPGWQKMWDSLSKAFPNAQLFSSVRPGAVTVSGNQSYHALGRAIDVTPSSAIAEWVRQNYYGSTKELIFTPFGSRQIKNGSDYVYGGEVAAQHWDHVHWAMKKGGILPYHSIPSLADGGVVLPRPGGSIVRLGERGQREEVNIRPLRDGDGKKEYHFHGNLVFPNISSPDDAKKFLRNLETIAGGS